LVNESIQMLVPLQREMELVSKLQRVAKALEGTPDTGDLDDATASRDAQYFQSFLYEADAKDRATTGGGEAAAAAVNRRDDINPTFDPASLVGAVEPLLRFLREHKDAPADAANGLRWDSVLVEHYAMSAAGPNNVAHASALRDDGHANNSIDKDDVRDDDGLSVTRKSGAAVAQEIDAELDRQTTHGAETEAKATKVKEENKAVSVDAVEGVETVAPALPVPSPVSSSAATPMLHEDEPWKNDEAWKVAEEQGLHKKTANAKDSQPPGVESAADMSEDTGTAGTEEDGVENVAAENVPTIDVLVTETQGSEGAAAAVGSTMEVATEEASKVDTIETRSDRTQESVKTETPPGKVASDGDLSSSTIANDGGSDQDKAAMSIQNNHRQKQDKELVAEIKARKAGAAAMTTTTTTPEVADKGDDDGQQKAAMSIQNKHRQKQAKERVAKIKAQKAGAAAATTTAPEAVEGNDEGDDQQKAAMSIQNKHRQKQAKERVAEIKAQKLELQNESVAAVPAAGETAVAVAKVEAGKEGGHGESPNLETAVVAVPENTNAHSSDGGNDGVSELAAVNAEANEVASDTEAAAVNEKESTIVAKSNTAESDDKTGQMALMGNESDNAAVHNTQREDEDSSTTADATVDGIHQTASESHTQADGGAGQINVVNAAALLAGPVGGREG
jgi:hypothetical protein